MGIDEPKPAPLDASSMSVEGQLEPSTTSEFWTLLVKVALKYLHDAGLSPGTTGEPAVDEGDALARPLKEAFAGIGDGLFLAYNEEEGLWEAYVVAADHTDALYEAVVSAEERLQSVLDANLSVRVRAHQGQPMPAVVPHNARRLLPS